jgi:hypothetical protein
MSSVSTGGAQTPPHVLPPPPAIVVQERFVAFHFKLAFPRLGVAYQLFFPLSKTFLPVVLSTIMPGRAESSDIRFFIHAPHCYAFVLYSFFLPPIPLFGPARS